MPNTIKIKRGLAANRSSVTPQEGEFLYTTDTKKVFIGDGSTAGGNALGDVNGPASATDNTIPLYDGTTGKLLKSTLGSGTAGQALLSGGAGQAPTWGNIEAGTAQFVSNAAITAGQSVILRSDGKVEPVTGVSQTETLGSATTNSSNGSPRWLVTTAIPGTSNYAFVFNSSIDSTPRIGLASVSGNTITYGSIQQLETGTGFSSFALVWHPVEGKLICIYTSPTLGARARIITISGTTITNISAQAGSFGYSAENNAMRGYYDTASNRIVVVNDLGGQTFARLYSVSGTTVTEVTTATISGPSNASALRAVAYDGTVGVVFYTLNTGATYAIRARTITTTASAITLGAESSNIATYASTAPWDDTGIAYDSMNNNFAIIYANNSDSKSYYATFSRSGNTISAIAGAQIAASKLQRVNVAYDEYARRIVAHYFITSSTATVSSFSNNAGVLTNTTTTTFAGETSAQWYNVAFISGANRCVLLTFNAGVQSRAFQPASNFTNAIDFIGIAATSAASSGQNVTVTVAGGINRNVTGLTTNAEYWVGANGTLQTTVGPARAGRALTATALQIEDRLANSGTASTSTFLRGDGAWAAPASTLTVISNVVLSSSATEIIINNIPATSYSSILIEMMLKPDSNTSISFQFVAPGGTSSTGQFYGAWRDQRSNNAGGNVISVNGSSQWYITPVTTSGGTSEINMMLNVQQTNQTTTKRAFKIFGCGDANASIGYSYDGGGYHNAQPWGGLRIFTDAGSFSAGSYYRIYGVL